MPHKKRLKRLWITTHRGVRNKLKPVRGRFCAKSRICRCNANALEVISVNFRGSLFKEVKFKNVKIEGCDFWGAIFKKCDFINTKIKNSNFVGCIFEDCKFKNSTFSYSCVVTTKYEEFADSIDSSCIIAKDYPVLKDRDFFIDRLESLKSNTKLRLTKIIHISDNKLNELNIFLLLKIFQREELVALLLCLCQRSMKNINTFDDLKMALKRLKKESNVATSRPTQSKGCAANEAQRSDWGLQQDR